MNNLARIVVLLLCLSLFSVPFVMAEEESTTETTKTKKAVEAPEVRGLEYVL